MCKLSHTTATIEACLDNPSLPMRLFTSVRWMCWARLRDIRVL